MARARLLILLPAIALALNGCVAGVVASAVGAAAGGGQASGKPANSKFMQAAARQACSTHASQYGTVEIIGVRQVDAEIIVSGTVTDASGRNNFDCSFVTEITGFKLQPIPPERSAPELDLKLDRADKLHPM